MEDSVEVEGIQVLADGASQQVGEVCTEEIVRIFLNDRHCSNLVATPGEYAELGAGFIVSEGLARDITKVRLCANEVHVYSQHVLDHGDVANRTDRNPLPSPAWIRKRGNKGPCLSAAEVFVVIDGIVSDLWKRTSGAHCSVIYLNDGSDNGIIARSSDVGRHNSVDKVIGHCVLNGIDLGSCVLGCTGRQPRDMVEKALNAGIPMVVTKASSTNRGIELARQAGITLVCRVRNGSFWVYSHPWRIKGIGDW
ncbi:MAG: formate dehydrogenase accessory sulfurtransferase FdhD [Thermodesulfobacteriota bacterium]|nr:formate dehydrogenase accessory sulfurtransferase FdhD [Thermodesulfobacteriota bacterium]